MRKISFKSKTTVLITLLTAIMCFASVMGMIAMSKRTVNAEIQQQLISTVERNTDEIEIENGILEIENDFVFYTNGIYCDVFDSNHAYIDGETPHKLLITDNFNAGEITIHEKNGNEYYVYDTCLEFSKYEYEIDVFSGQIIKYGADAVKPGTLEEKNHSNFFFENGISTEEAIDTALSHAGANRNNSQIIKAELQAHENRQVFLIEFTCSNPLYGNIWLRGSTPADTVQNAFGAINKTFIYMIPMFIIIAALGAYLISKKTIKPVENISKSAREISSGNDLSKRINSGNGSDEIAVLADTFNQMLQRLQTSFESEKQFTSDASHELRTPLAVIKAECEYALSDKADNDDKEEALISINEQNEKMTKLVNSLLSLARTEQGTQRFKFEKTNLSELIEQICEGFVPEKGIRIEYNIENDIYYSVEASLISRMLENLLSNAVRYGNKNGNINVTLKKGKNRIILSVKDNGIGIKENDIDKIFGRFYRADSSRSNSDGFGLGLALVDRIVSLHGGKAEVKSVFGEGSEFSITFFEKN